MMHTQKVCISHFMDQSIVDQLTFAANRASKDREDTKVILIVLLGMLLDNKAITKVQYNKMIKMLGYK
jgi:hypothetical protein